MNSVLRSQLPHTAADDGTPMPAELQPHSEPARARSALGRAEWPIHRHGNSIGKTLTREQREWLAQVLRDQRWEP